jgi:hypothetical protein
MSTSNNNTAAWSMSASYLARLRFTGFANLTPGPPVELASFSATMLGDLLAFAARASTMLTGC